MVAVSSKSDSSRPKRLLILLTDYHYFLSHKRNLVDAARSAGFEVFVAARGAQGSSTDFTARDIDWQRSDSLVTAALRCIPDVMRICRLIDDVRPDVLHNIALKPAVIGSLAAISRDTTVFNSINGFGFVFQARSVLARAAQWVFGAILRRSVQENRARIVLQNNDDLALTRDRLNIPEASLRLIRGSGVDPAHFAPQSVPLLPPFRFLVLARLLHLKGISVAVEAHQLLRARGQASELVVAGGPDPANPSAISAETIRRWSELPGIRFLGHVGDVRRVIAESHVVVHPALGGEGLPKSLLEAAASGRAMIATDIPGNREIVVANETGMLVPPGDAEALSGAMAWAKEHWPECQRLGAAARAKALKEFTVSHVTAAHERLYGESVTAAT